MDSPFRNQDRIIRFLNDQQVCYCWYLYLPHDSEPFVIASSEPFLEQIDFDQSPSWVNEVKEKTFFVGNSFDEFIYRFWIENVIWFNLYLRIPLSNLQLEYIWHIQPSYIDPNGR